MKSRIRQVWSFGLITFCLGSFGALATESAPIPIPAAARPSAHFDPEAATNAYLALIPPSAKSRSDAYFEGGYWLQLWNFVYGAAIALLLLNLRWSAAMRNLAERITPFGPIRTALYWTQYSLLVAVLGFPLAVYEGYFREHQYGLATQTFGPWLFDQFKGLLLNIVLGAIITAVIFGLVRRLPRTWWIWGALVTLAFLIFVVLIGPVFIVPIFNKVTRLQDPRVTEPILRLARANGIPARDVFQIDASRQTTRISANVSGFGKTMRITLNDNLLRRGSPEEIQAVMGHEMGHYVLNHVYKFIVYFLVIIVVWFAALQWAETWALARWGEKWQIRGIGDTAVLPLVVLVSAIFFFVLTPVVNTITRVQEYEADMFGLNASRQPDGFAQAAIHLSEYRKMSPGPVEEWIFYDHPSGRNRILAAMRWKGENLELFEAQHTAASRPLGLDLVAQLADSDPHSARESKKINPVIVTIRVDKQQSFLNALHGRPPLPFLGVMNPDTELKKDAEQVGFVAHSLEKEILEQVAGFEVFTVVERARQPCILSRPFARPQDSQRC